MSVQRSTSCLDRRVSSSLFHLLGQNMFKRVEILSQTSIFKSLYLCNRIL